MTLDFCYDPLVSKELREFESDAAKFREYMKSVQSITILLLYVIFILVLFHCLTGHRITLVHAHS